RELFYSHRRSSFLHLQLSQPPQPTLIPYTTLFRSLSFFKLNQDTKISQLSKGNKAKVNLLLGLALDVEYVLMDEHFSGIDIFSREQIANVFTSHLFVGLGVIITKHEIQDIEHLMDKSVLVDRKNLHLLQFGL